MPKKETAWTRLVKETWAKHKGSKSFSEHLLDGLRTDPMVGRDLHDGMRSKGITHLLTVGIA
eukprot:12717-Eustigmatos_ZCMA.PRE.1